LNSLSDHRMSQPIRVLIVDDSALMRQMLTAVLNSDPRILVVDTASDPLVARQKIKKLNPDVITLDVEMPRMNGLDFLQKIMTLRPTPVIMISSLTGAGADASLKALELGAVDVIAKPLGFIGDGIDGLRDVLIEKIMVAASSRVQPVARPFARPPQGWTGSFRDHVIAIGASTGALPAVAGILQTLPANAPPVLIAQHMPESFTPRFARRVDALCRITVVEAQDGMRVEPGHAYISPGGHMTRITARRTLAVTTEDKVNGFQPSVDVLFGSIAEHVGGQGVGAILTGMGRDGAQGLLQMRRAGGLTLGQDADSCVVYGMPRIAFEIGAVGRQLPPLQIAAAILEHCSVRPSQKTESVLVR